MSPMTHPARAPSSGWRAWARSATTSAVQKSATRSTRADADSLHPISFCDLVVLPARARQIGPIGALKKMGSRVGNGARPCVRRRSCRGSSLVGWARKQDGVGVAMTVRFVQMLCVTALLAAGCGDPKPITTDDVDPDGGTDTGTSGI